MLAADGLDKSRQEDLATYLKKISIDATPNTDYRVVYQTRRTALENPTGGNASRGKELTQQYCNLCHAEKSIRPPLTPGLYTADFLVKRIRWLDGHDARQMPPLYIDRLTDSELRDIVTFLVGTSGEQIFQRDAAP